MVFANLLNTAAKYTERGGRISLAAELDAHALVVRVTDNGIGISADALGRIFDMFTQAQHGVQRSQGGLGVGLTLAKRLAAMHGGDITARSAGLGKGSEFIVHLPIGFSAQPVPRDADELAAC